MMKQATVDLGEEMTLYEKHTTQNTHTSTQGSRVLFFQTVGVLLPCVWWVVHYSWYPTESHYTNGPLELGFTVALLSCVVSLQKCGIKDFCRLSDEPESVPKLRLLVFLLPSGLNMVFSFLCSNYFPLYFQNGMHFHIVMYLTCDVIFSINWVMMPRVKHLPFLNSVCLLIEISCIIFSSMLFSASLVGVFRHLYLANFAVSLWCVVHVIFDTGVIGALAMTFEEKAKRSVPVKGIKSFFLIAFVNLTVLALIVWGTRPIFQMIFGDFVKTKKH